MKLIGTILTLFMLVFALPSMTQAQNEQLAFELRFGIIKGGEAVYKCSDTTLNNHTAVFTYLQGNTSGFTDFIYKVNDEYTSLLDNSSLLPIWSTKALSEQKFRFYEKINYDQQTGEVVSNHLGKRNTAKNICDISALMCYFRFSGLLDTLQANQILHLPFWDTNEWYYLDIKYTGTEQIKTKLGEFNCLRFEPLHIAGRFFNRKNPMNIWITDDSRRLPVLMERNFTIGSVKCELVDDKPLNRLKGTFTEVH